jgi:hypothetical protein|nr:MAG TPA: hypothetical protein [Caudoviricetes sp.]
MRKISLQPAVSEDGAVEVNPADTTTLTVEEHTLLENALKELTFLKSYSSRLTIRLASWDAVEAAFDGERVRVVPDETKNPDKYAVILFSIGEENE